MKWHRKINKGFVALMLVIALLVGYRVVQNQSRKQGEPALKRLTEDYLATAIGLEYVPQDLVDKYAESNKSLAEFTQSDEYQKQVDKAKVSLAPFYAADGRYLNFQINRLELKWQDQLYNRNTLDLKYSLQSYERINYVDDLVTVTIQLEYDFDNGNYYGMENLQFEKIAGEWKVLAGEFTTQYMAQWR